MIPSASAAGANALATDDERAPRVVRAWAQALYELLRPYAQLTVATTGGSYHLGSVALYLGMLAATTERHETAAEHFEDALEANARMGTRPWEAWTRGEYGRLLLARREPHDRERAERLLTEAHATAQALGMRGLLERIARTRP